MYIMMRIELPFDKRQLFEAMTSAQLHTLILQDDDDSKLALWYVLFFRIKDKLWLNFQQFFENRDEASRDFEDYLCDFFLYVYEYRPKDKSGHGHYYMLGTLNDNTRMFVFLQNVFKRYLKEESEQLDKIRDAEPQVIEEQRYSTMKDIVIDMHRIGYALAYVNQTESVENRYILFRAISRKVLEDLSIIGFPPDDEVAGILGLTYTTYRTRASRLFKSIRDLINSEERLPTLDEQNQELMVSICSNEEDLTEVIRRHLLNVEGFLDKEQQQTILSRRYAMQGGVPTLSTRYEDSYCCEEKMAEPYGTFMANDDVRFSIQMPSAVERRFRRMFFDYNERREMQMEQLEKAEQRNTFASKLKKIFSRL